MKMTEEEIEALLDEEFPQLDGRFHVLELTADGARVEMEAAHRHLRPGGTVSGPAMFELADVGFYIALLARVGPKTLTVTTNASINFMRKPNPGKLTAEARVLKMGKSLCVGDVLVFSEGVDGPVAHAAMTYSIPPSPDELTKR